jgi:glycosyltransferase involved in cell wall biosynthesis
LIVACIPAYNEEDTIAKIILLTKKYVDKVIVCDDGSTDLTGEIAVGLSALLIKHTQRKGYGAAVRSLFNKAIKLGADLVVTLDGDGQHNPDELPMLIEPILQGNADMVIGSRFIDENANDVPRLRRIGIGAITLLTSNCFGS